jgi:hypothetical protein
MDVAVILLPGILGSPLKCMYSDNTVWPVHDELTLAGKIIFRDPLEKAGSFAQLISTPYTYQFNKRATVMQADLQNRTENVARLYHQFINQTNKNDSK